MKPKPVFNVSRRTFIKGTVAGLGIATLPLAANPSEAQQRTAPTDYVDNTGCLTGPLDLNDVRLERPF